MTLTIVPDEKAVPLGESRFPAEPLPPVSEVWQLDGRSHRSPREARTRVLDMCRRWGLSGDAAHDLAVIASELTTNAVVHAPGETVSVSLMLNAGGAHVVVADRGCFSGFSTETVADDEHGRGLFMVAALADRFAIMPVGGGTVAWALLCLPDAPA